jgi:reactive intermediate/imine deaminase
MPEIKFLTHEGATGGPPLSPAVRAGDFVFVSGQVPVDETGVTAPYDVEAQTRQVMRNLERALKLAGCTLADVVKTTVFLEDARDFARFNKAYAEAFKGRYPARTTAEARLMGSFLVEIEAVAYKPA